MNRTPENLAEVEAMEAGPELDALVAQHALGWKIDWNDQSYFDRRGAYAYVGADDKRRAVPPFSSDSLHSELLIQAIRERQDGHFTLLAFTTGWKALGHTPDVRSGHPAGSVEFSRLASANTRALAISRCALRVFVLDDYGPTDEEVQEAERDWNEMMGR